MAMIIFDYVVLSFSWIRHNPIVFLTLVLAITTFWYAYHTRKMSIIMSADFLLRTRPYLTIDNRPIFNIPPEQLKLNRISKVNNIEFLMKNVGVVPLMEVKKTLKINGVERMLCHNAPAVIFPSSSLGYTISGFDLDKVVTADKLFGEIDLTVEYWALGNDKKKYFYRRAFRIEGHKWFSVIEDAN